MLRLSALRWFVLRLVLACELWWNCGRIKARGKYGGNVVILRRFTARFFGDIIGLYSY